MQRIAPVIIIEYAYEAICKVIKDKTAAANSNDDNPIDYYQAVKVAYNESQHLRLYSNIDNQEEKKIDKDLTTLWPFTYKIVNEEKERFILVNVDPDNLLVSWMPGKLTRLEEIKRLTEQNT